MSPSHRNARRRTHFLTGLPNHRVLMRDLLRPSIETLRLDGRP